MQPARGRHMLLGGIVVVVALAVLALGGTLRVARAQAEGMVAIVDYAFDPAMISVPGGTTVTWTNFGATPHTVTSYDGTIDSGNLEPGASFSQRFFVGGSYTFHCRIHPGMTSTIVVDGGDPVASLDLDMQTALLPPVGVGTMASQPSVWLAPLLAILAAMLGVTAIALRRT